MKRNVPAKLLATLLLAFAFASIAPGLAFADELGEQSANQQTVASDQAADATDNAKPTVASTQAVGTQPTATENVNAPQDSANTANTATPATEPAADNTENKAETTKPAADTAKQEEAEDAANASDASANLNTEAVQKKDDASAKETKLASAEDTTKEVKAEETAALQTQETYPNASVKFRVHVQNVGNQSWRTATTDGNTAQAGTSGRSLRLEGLWMQLEGEGARNSSIEYQVHVQNVGWQTVRADGQMAGTSGKSYRLEGVRIALTGELSRFYDIEYRVHVQNDGWQSFVKNGAFAGTEGRGLRLEALEMRLVKKGTVLTESQDGIVGLTYRSHVQNVGNQAYVNSPSTTGTSGQALRVEAIQILLNSGRYSGGIEYQAHVQNIGWQGWKSNGASAGTSGRGLRVEAIKVQLTGDISNYYDVVYRAHVQNIGWQPWTVDGNVAGTSGKSLRVEALQVKLVKKGSAQNLSEGTYVISLVNDVSSELAASGTQLKKATYSTTDNAGKFYVRNENGGVTLQSVSTGKFLTDGGSLDLQSWSGATPQVWSLSWDGGYVIANKSTGLKLALSGNSGTTSTNGSRWMASSVQLLSDGNYVVKNVAQGKALDVQGASLSGGANIMVHAYNGGGNQVFTFADLGNGYYWMVNTMSYKGVEVANGSTNNGANVYQANSCSARKSQQWKVSLDHEGGFVFTNRASGKVLTASGSGGEDANVVSSADAGSATQRWLLTASKYQANPALPRAINIAKGLSSSTDWLITLDLSNHWLTIFHWTSNGWEMYHNWKVSVGAPETPTPTGSYKVFSRCYTFGDSYSVYYCTEWYDGFFFHSIKYYPGTHTVKDGRLGKNISMGCVRMDIDNSHWIYNNIPNGTKVKIYN